MTRAPYAHGDLPLMFLGSQGRREGKADSSHGLNNQRYCIPGKKKGVENEASSGRMVKKRTSVVASVSPTILLGRHLYL